MSYRPEGPKLLNKEDWIYWPERLGLGLYGLDGLDRPIGPIRLIRAIRAIIPIIPIRLIIPNRPSIL